jgi:hypothetical protein
MKSNFIGPNKYEKETDRRFQQAKRDWKFESMLETTVLPKVKLYRRKTPVYLRGIGLI